MRTEQAHDRQFNDHYDGRDNSDTYSAQKIADNVHILKAI